MIIETPRPCRTAEVHAVAWLLVYPNSKNLEQQYFVSNFTLGANFWQMAAVLGSFCTDEIE